MTDLKYQKIAQVLGQNRLRQNESLAKYSTFQIGGPAYLFYQATTESELINAVKQGREKKIPVFILGGGTNLLISDSGFAGLVVKNETGSIKMVGLKGNRNKETKSVQVQEVFLRVDSGVGINRLVRYAIDQGLSGLEYFLGQPGTVGGAVYINAHNMSMGKFFGDVVQSARILDANNKIITVSRDYFKFGYDHSIIQKTADIVLSVVLHLKKAEKAEMWKVAQNVLDRRRKTQPVGYYSSGCIFQNISVSEAHRLATPDYTCSAGYLLESALLKNKYSGKAQFSDTHANFIVHQGQATARDVIKLIDLAKRAVKKKYAVELKEEIVKVGQF